MIRVSRYQIDEDAGVLRVFIHFPDYISTAANNERIWDLVEALENNRSIETKDGYLHGYVNGCGPDEVMATKQLR